MTNALIRIFIKDRDNVRDARVRERYGVLSGAVGIACNLLLFVLKVLIGLFTGSISIAADAFNNLSDGLSCLISIVGFKVSGREPDAKHPFGYGRTEYIAGLIVSFIIVIVGFEFFKTSFSRILHPEPIAFSAVLTVILAISMLVKLWMGTFNHRIGTLIDSPVLMAARQDSLNDVITTGVVVVGMIAGRFTTLPVDGYIGVLVALFILWAGFNIARDTVAPLLGEAADPEIVRTIENIVMEADHIVGVHDVIVHNYGAGRTLASLHAEVPSDADFVAVHEVIDEAEKRVWHKTGVYLVIHMDPVDVNNAHVSALRAQVDGVLREIDEGLTMHDFRVVDGERHINLIFDVVVPYSYNDEGKRTLMITMRNKMKEIDKRYNLVVTFDHQM
ncbi:cation diffusion facilitator family transporter [Butyricicoccus sp. Marseille-Q5471]|uniref:cation diffusion facilitator family transporter n=1 Tax=Butyricicoccus sp. Marseille-Q5471 TaxID=3039493 RepID=UPI0024BC1FD1|nr:cation diffusion facilitator family transporter [Butyricicoccus sp. Marseille-Q5471]